MAHYAHVIKLHGGSAGAKSGNPEVALRHYRKVLENRINCIKAEIATEVYKYQVPGISIKDEHRPRWSGAFRANWKVQIGHEGQWESVLPETKERFPWNGDEGDDNNSYKYARLITLFGDVVTLQNEAISKMSVEEPIFVYNPSPYAEWLNKGGLLGGTFKTYEFAQTGDGKWIQEPSDFIKGGYEAVRGKIGEIISRGLARAATIGFKG